MKNVWVYKFDGLIQCDDSSVEISLEEMKNELATIIGEDEILNMEKRAMTMIQMCGMPSGSANAYEITADGYWKLMHGIAGPQGFMVWPSEMPESLGQKQRIGRSIRDTPTTVKELIGRPLRAYKTGDALTEDWRPDRINIETDEQNIIQDIWFG